MILHVHSFKSVNVYKTIVTYCNSFIKLIILKKKYLLVIPPIDVALIGATYWPETVIIKAHEKKKKVKTQDVGQKTFLIKNSMILCPTQKVDLSVDKRCTTLVLFSKDLLYVSFFLLLISNTQSKKALKIYFKDSNNILSEGKYQHSDIDLLIKYYRCQTLVKMKVVNM